MDKVMRAGTGRQAPISRLGQAMITKTKCQML
jgi:hypothetical protein